MKPYILGIAAVSLFVVVAAFAQSAESPIHPDDAAGIMNALPPELHKKLQQLSELLDQNIKAGKITDAQIQQQLTSGRLEQTIRSLGPEANHLFDEIQADMKNGNGPGKDALLPLLGGLSGAGK
ncbi:MAG TPA: hypothetical protein VJU54_01720 [Nitrospiraceae bacterium]|nr:hypothetical protein [Nitrospiraceae bacterium]